MRLILLALLLILRTVKHREVQLLLLLAAYFLVAGFLPPVSHQWLYTVSIFIKDLLMWLLPITVMFFIAHTVSTFQKKALFFIVFLFVFEGISNFTSVWYAFGCGHIAKEYLPTIALTPMQDDFTAFWRIPMKKPVWWAADKGTMLGLAIGLIAAFGRNAFLKQKIDQGKKCAEWVLTKVFSRLIPLFVLGFVARIYQTQLLHQMLAHCGALLLWLVLFLALYVVGLFFIGSGLSPKETVQGIKNLLPAGSMAFASGCSISTMPFTIEGTSKNLQNPSFAKAVIPATTNIQQIGDCIIQAFLCFLIYRSFYGHSPDPITWIKFTTLFVLARFGTAAVLGGAIFIMLPIYESRLSFTPEMIAVILAFNVMLDPLVTSCNVMANGALCRIFERVWLAVQAKASTSYHSSSSS